MQRFAAAQGSRIVKPVGAAVGASVGTSTAHCRISQVRIRLACFTRSVWCHHSSGGGGVNEVPFRLGKPERGETPLK